MDLLSSILTIFFSHQLKLKIFHFQTKGYGSHKASDSYLTKFEDNLDKFFEVAQGVYGKLNMDNFKIECKTINDDNIMTELDKFIKLLLSFDEQFKGCPELLNIRDDMLGDLKQFKYLLTFK